MLENWSPLRILVSVLSAWGLTFTVTFLTIYCVLFS